MSFSLSGFVDADWVGDVNDRRSTQGSVLLQVQLHNRVLFYYSSYYGNSRVSLVSPFNYSIPIYCDNESAIKLAANPVFHAHTKHIETLFHFVREKVLIQDIELQKIRTEDQVADIFTKALAKAKFEVFRGVLGVVENKFA